MLKAFKCNFTKYTDQQMCMGLVAIATFGIPRIYQINDLLKTEPQVAHLIGLPQFFDQSTAHRYLNRFGKWHVNQLDRVNTQVLLAHGESTRQDVVILDIDSQTHTLESRKREGAVIGKNRKKPGKPCLQWNVGFVRGENEAYLHLVTIAENCCVLFKKILPAV